MDSTNNMANPSLVNGELNMQICPRCKQATLDPRNYGESGLYGANHKLCVPCFFDEDTETEERGTNNLPDVLDKYGPSNRD